MKKIVILFVSVFIFSACTEDIEPLNTDLTPELIKNTQWGVFKETKQNGLGVDYDIYYVLQFKDVLGARYEAVYHTGRSTGSGTHLFHYSVKNGIINNKISNDVNDNGIYTRDSVIMFGRTYYPIDWLLE